ncbi:hypothetical protein MMC16_002940 [Acarospora aff. strigata]|nr:hypothetical protein [Acarospora aff. strigata]
MFSNIFDSLPDNCAPTNGFLVAFSSTFHTCVPTPLAFLSTALGTLSIVSWLFAQLPQIIKNHSLKSTSGLSAWFLVEWCAGDTTNLFGAVLTRQAGWQVIVASYYVSVDVVLVWQWMWYTYYKPWREARVKPLFVRSGGGGNRDGDLEQIREGIPPVENSLDPLLATENNPEPKEYKHSAKPISAHIPGFRDIFNAREKTTPPSSHRSITRNQSSSLSPGPSPKALLFISMLCAALANAAPLTTSPVTASTSAPRSSAQNAELAGRFLSWGSTLLYLVSRLPQLYKNHIRRSTSGLSPTLFIAAFFGNLFYSTSLLTNPYAWHDFPAYGGGGWAGSNGSVRREWLKLAAPFWLGAAGVLGLDATVGLQFWMFGEGEVEKVVRVRDERGRERWRKVSGWMRGWVPSVSPCRRGVAEAGERESLLGGGREDDGEYGAA